MWGCRIGCIRWHADSNSCKLLKFECCQLPVQTSAAACHCLNTTSAAVAGVFQVVIMQSNAYNSSLPMYACYSTATCKLVITFALSPPYFEKIDLGQHWIGSRTDYLCLFNVYLLTFSAQIKLCRLLLVWPPKGN